MYSIESIRKMQALFAKNAAKYAVIPVNGIKMCISRGNRKIGLVMNVSLPPVRTCANCSECMFYCYDIKACLQYPDTVIDARMRNYTILMRDRDEYFARIDAAMSRRRKNKYFRWHVAGDIVDVDYFARMVDNARRHPDFIIWTYTKNYAVVNAYVAAHGGNRIAAIPGNMHVMFSEWDGMDLVNPYGFPVFTCKMRTGNKNHPAEYFDTLYHCPGNCDECKAGNRGCIGGEDTYTEDH